MRYLAWAPICLLATSPAVPIQAQVEARIGIDAAPVAGCRRIILFDPQSRTPAQTVPIACLKDNGLELRGMEARIGRPTTSFAATPEMGANWLMRDAAVVIVSPKGMQALVGAARTSAGNASGVPAEIRAAIGVAGAVIGDVSHAPSWGLYSDLQLQSDATSYGLEVAAKNRSGIDRTSYPYTLSNGVIGIWLAAGGDARYGGAPTKPSNVAIQIGKNGSTWNRGIVFAADGLTGSDGVNGFATAIEMAKGQLIQWRGPGNVDGGAIYSTVDNVQGVTRVSLENGQVGLRGAGGTPILLAKHAVKGVNYIEASSAPSGRAVSIRATGGDLDADLELSGKGSGGVLLGSGARLRKTAVSGLPKCGAALEGMLFAITDARSATFNAPLAGGGNNHVIGFCNGSNWTVH